MKTRALDKLCLKTLQENFINSPKTDPTFEENFSETAKTGRKGFTTVSVSGSGSSKRKPYQITFE